MIKASELRVGNFVLYLNELYLVDGIKYEPNAPDEKWRIAFRTIDADNMLGQILRNAKMENWIDPIPLTEDWLHKFGVTWNNINGSEYYFTTTGLYGLRLDPPTKGKDDGWTPMTPDGDGSIGKEIFFVHQLQNLYYSLCGEELTIKEPA